MSPADPPIVSPSGRLAYGWLCGQEPEQRVHFILAGVVLVRFGRENIGALGRHVCFRKDRVVGDSPDCQRFRSSPGRRFLHPEARRTRPVVVASEGGHTTLPANSVREDAVLNHLRMRFDHVSAERVLSGPGLENLYHAIATLDGVDAPSRNAAEITTAALLGTCGTSGASLDMFCAIL
jgi:hypothetical protein